MPVKKSIAIKTTSVTRAESQPPNRAVKKRRPSRQLHKWYLSFSTLQYFQESDFRVGIVASACPCKVIFAVRNAGAFCDGGDKGFRLQPLEIQRNRTICINLCVHIHTNRNVDLLRFLHQIQGFRLRWNPTDRTSRFPHFSSETEALHKRSRPTYPS